MCRPFTATHRAFSAADAKAAEDRVVMPDPETVQLLRKRVMAAPEQQAQHGKRRGGGRSVRFKLPAGCLK